MIIGTRVYYDARQPPTVRPPAPSHGRSEPAIPFIASLDLYEYDVYGTTGGALWKMLVRGSPDHLASLHVELFTLPVRIGERSPGVAQGDDDGFGVAMHDRLLTGRVINAENPDLVVFKLHFIVLRIYFRGVLRDA